MQATTEGSLLGKVGDGYRIHNFIMIFIHYIYKYSPTYRITLPSYPTRETNYQIGMALGAIFGRLAVLSKRQRLCQGLSSYATHRTVYSF